MVKFTPEQAMKTQMGSKGMALLFLSHLIVHMFMRNKNKLHQPFIFILHNSTLSYTSQQMWVGSQHHAPATLPPGKTQYPMYMRLGKTQGWSRWVRKILSPSGSIPRPSIP